MYDISCILTLKIKKICIHPNQEQDPYYVTWNMMCIYAFQFLVLFYHLYILQITEISEHHVRMKYTLLRFEKC